MFRYSQVLRVCAGHARFFARARDLDLDFGFVVEAPGFTMPMS